MNVIDDDYLPCRLAALEKLADDLSSRLKHMERIAKALKLSYAANVVTVLTHDLLASMDSLEFIETNDSTFSERATRYDLVRRGQQHQEGQR